MAAVPPESRSRERWRGEVGLSTISNYPAALEARFVVREHYVLNEIQGRLQRRDIRVCPDVDQSFGRTFGGVGVDFVDLDALLKALSEK